MVRILDARDKRSSPRSITINGTVFTVLEDSKGKIGIEIAFQLGGSVFFNPHVLGNLARDGREMVSHKEDFFGVTKRVFLSEVSEFSVVARIDHHGIILEIAGRDPIGIDHDFDKLEDLCSFAIKEHAAQLIS